MNPFKIKKLSKVAKDQTGWAYDDIPWFSKEETGPAEIARQHLLGSLSCDLEYSFNGTKPHLGPLSPGCLHCGTPASIFHFINRQCTRSCFFCPENRTHNPDLQPWTDGLWFEDDEIFIHFLKTFSIKSVGFTGGEPLLALEKLLSRIYKIRRSFGQEIHLRLYTNGDLLDHETLRKLREVKLDELRINISARDYDLSPVRLARLSGIPVVTVEIPAIPEHMETVKKAMLVMEDLGVDYLNLIQLEVTRDNYLALGLEHYHVIHRPTLLPVFESEICSLKLMLYRQEKQLRLPVSYCGFPYRFEMTNTQRSMRYNHFDLKGWEEVTKAGFIRTLVLVDNDGQVKNLMDHLEKNTAYIGLWMYDSARSELCFHSKLFPDLLSAGNRFKVRYQEKILSAFSLDLIEWRRDLLAEVELSRPAVECWRQIYVGNRDPKEAIRDFIQDYPVKEKFTVTLMSMEKQLLRELSIWEWLEEKFPEPLF